MKKFIALLLCLALILPFAFPAKAETISLDASTDTLTAKTEILSKRDTYSKTYLLSDGTYQYVSYAEPIHYQDSTGAYVEINNEIASTVNLDGYAYANTSDGYKYTNTSNAWNAHFSEKLNNSSAVMLTSGQYNIAFSFAEQTGNTAVMKATALPTVSAKSILSSAYHQKLSADNRAVIYKDVAEDVDIAYTVQTGALKEDIILKSKQAPSAFKFRLTANGLTLRENGDTISLFTAAGKDVFTFAPLYMEDANGKLSESVSLTYTSVKNGYELTVSADTEFLNAADTVYPVVIDPSIMVTGSSRTYDTCVDQQYPYSNYYLSENLWTGGAYGTNAMRTYIKFDIPTDIRPNQITSANIYLLKKDYQAPTVRAYLVTENWSSSTVTWNNQPGYDQTIYSPTAAHSTLNWYGLNITNILKCWLYGSYANYGVVLKEPNENSSTQKTKFYSSDAPSPNKPELVINYTPYYGTRPYQEIFLKEDRESVNCMGYALEYRDYITMEDLGMSNADVLGMNLAQLEAYCKGKSEIWMNANIGSSNWARIATYDTNIQENWFRAVLRVGFIDLDDDDMLDSGEEWDYHWWYQTNAGDWAEKLADRSSEYHPDALGIDPTTLVWENENLLYNSAGVFYQIADIRDVFY